MAEPRAADERVALEARIEALEERVRELERGISVLTGRLETVESVSALSAWIAHQPLRTQPLVSVVLPTRDRLDRLPRAIESVRAQRYEHWELLVIDDSGTDDTGPLVAELGDERVRRLSTARLGAGAARNAGLEAATGELVAYADDDNMMDRDWLQSVVWGFETFPASDALYGAYVIDDLGRLNESGAGTLPQMVLSRWSEGVLAEYNVADLGAVAHRAGLAGARFDPDLVTLGDWDLLVRLTAERPPLVLPVIATYYTSDAPDRLTTRGGDAETLALVRSRAAAAASTGSGTEA